jgi:hypothetical protein
MSSQKSNRVRDCSHFMLIFSHCYHINVAQASRSNDSRGPLRLYHQNIRGIKGKLNELMIHLSKVTPDIICLMEHHFNASEIELTYLTSYILGANFCREKLKNGGACIYIHEDLNSLRLWCKHVPKNKN